MVPGSFLARPAGRPWQRRLSELGTSCCATICPPDEGWSSGTAPCVRPWLWLWHHPPAIGGAGGVYSRVSGYTSQAWRMAAVTGDAKSVLQPGILPSRSN